MFQSVLMAHDQIHVALHQNAFFPPSYLLFREIQTVKNFAFVVKKCLRTVQVFRFFVRVFFENSSAETDRLTVQIKNRKNYPAAKSVKPSVLILFFNREPRFLNVGGFVSFRD